MKQFLLILLLKQAKKPRDRSSIQDYVHTSVACHYEYVVYLQSAFSGSSPYLYFNHSALIFPWNLFDFYFFL